MSQQCYVFCGEEPYLIKQSIEQLKQQHAAAHLVQFSDQFNLNELRDCVNMNSLFSASQLILIKNPWFLSKAPSDTELSLIKSIISTISSTPHTLVIYVFGAIDQRKKLAAFLKKNSAFTIHNPFKEWEQDKIFQWLKAALQTRHKTIDQNALIALEQIGGTQLQLLSNELDTLCLYLGDRTHITVDDIKAMSADQSANTFNLIEALQTGQRAAITHCLTLLLRSGEDPIRLLGLIVSQIRLYIQLLQLQAQRLPAASIAKSLGKSPYYIQKLLPSLTKAYQLPDLIQRLQELANADFDIKSGRKKPVDALRLALL